MSENNETLAAILKLLEKIVGGSDSHTIPVIKQFADEKMEAIEWLYPVEQDDLHGERIDRDEAVKLVKSLQENIEKGKVKAALNHTVELSGVQIVKAWINECDCYIGDTLVPEGWPLVKTKFTSPELWEARKSGVLLGLSMGARGRREEVEE